jgi:hypothetical protein
LLEVGYQRDVDLADVRATLSEAKFKGVNVQYFEFYLQE